MATTTTTSIANVTVMMLRAAKPHHVSGFGLSDGLATTFVILNGYSFAFVTLLCLVLNIITIPLMLQRDIVIPSYLVLTAITVSDMLMALSSLPFSVYFYLLGGYKSFVPYYLCFAQRTFNEVVPAALHTMSIWCTVYLAVHRYREVTTTSAKKRKMSVTGGSASRNDFITVVIHISIVAFFSFFVQSFRFFDTDIIPVRIMSPTLLYDSTSSEPYVSCSMRLKPFITASIGKNGYFLTYLWMRTICVQILPCAILIFVNILLIRILNERIEVRKNMLKKSDHKPASGSKSATASHTLSVPLKSAEVKSDSQVSSSLLNEQLQSQQQNSNKERGHVALRNWRLITRMLWLIVLITLLVELPFAIWFIYLCVDITAFHFRLPGYIVNIVSSSLNLLLLLTTPLKFLIYFTMIKPFRDKLQSLQSGLTMRLLKHANRLRHDADKLDDKRDSSDIALEERGVNREQAVKEPTALSISEDTARTYHQTENEVSIEDILDEQSQATNQVQREMRSILVKQQTHLSEEDTLLPVIKEQ